MTKALSIIGIAIGWIVVLAFAAGMFIIFWAYRVGRFCLGYGWEMPGRPLTVIEELRIKGTHYGC